MSLSFIARGRMGARKAAFVLMKHFLFDLFTVVLIAHPSAFVPIHAKKVILKQVVLLVKVLN